MRILVNRDKKLGDCSSWPIWTSKPDHFDWKYEKEEHCYIVEGEATIETYTVMYENQSPCVAHAACLLDDGQRTWANILDPDIIASMITSEFCGRSGTIDTNGHFTPYR